MRGLKERCALPAHGNKVCTIQEITSELLSIGKHLGVDKAEVQQIIDKYITKNEP